LIKIVYNVSKMSERQNNQRKEAAAKKRKSLTWKERVDVIKGLWCWEKRGLWCWENDDVCKAVFFNYIKG
jgi:hypothetical protein